MVKKYFVLFVILFLSVTLVGCKDDLPDPDLEVRSVSFKDDVSMFQFNLESFKLEDIELEVVYTDDSKKIVRVTKDMISDEDFDTLFTTGSYFVDINYEGLILEATIQMSNGTSPQTRMPQVVVYSLKTIEDDSVIYSFYSTSTGNYTSYLLTLNHNLVNHDIEVSNQKGILSYNIEANKLVITHSFGQLMVGRNLLFEIILEDTDAELNFLNIESSFYGFNENVYLIEDIRYYNR